MPVAYNSVVIDPFMEYAMIIDPDTMLTKIMVDTFISFVWTERYNGCGEFVLQMPVLASILSTDFSYNHDGEIVRYQGLRIDDYVSIKESDHLMVLETIILKTDLENGDTIEISGRSLECQLERRIIWKKFTAVAKTVGEGDNATKEAPLLQESVETLLTQNAIAPTNEKRKIPRLVFEKSDDEAITSLRAELSYFGENLYESIYKLCEEREIGFHVIPNSNDEFVFKLYAGVDRSSQQEKNPIVAFNSRYENLLNSNYAQSEKDYISNALVRMGEDNNLMEVLRKPERIGLKRREMFVSADSPEDGTKLDKYLEQAKEAMSEHNVTTAFDSEVDWTRQFIFGRDYHVGDIVDVENQYGFGGRCRVTEVVRTRDASGPSMIPTFIMYEPQDIISKKEGD